ncbi:MAG TPA: hypothetical protein VFV66_01475 [Nonomuraea sp.]|nr:hypothetical protein [Nonomuraea sp.]
MRPTSPRTSIGRNAPALYFDLPVLVLLMACWFTVSVAAAHLITGLALSAMIVIHLLTRPARLLRPGKAVRLAAYVPLALLAIGMTITGLLRWAGVPPQQAWHAILAYTLLPAALVHAWLVRRALLRRTTRRAR